MIPPSIAMILFAAVSEKSVVRIFTAGVIPGLLFALALQVTSCSTDAVARSIRRGHSACAAYIAKHDTQCGRLECRIMILGGIYSGAFTATGRPAALPVSTRSPYPADLSRDDMGADGCDGQDSGLHHGAGYGTLCGSGRVFVVAHHQRSWARNYGTIQAVEHASLGTAAHDQCGSAADRNILGPSPCHSTAYPNSHADHQRGGRRSGSFCDYHDGKLEYRLLTPRRSGSISFVAQAVFKQPISVIYRGVMPFIWLSVAVLMLITYVPILSIGIFKLM